MFTSPLDCWGKGCEFRGRADANTSTTSPSCNLHLLRMRPFHITSWQTPLPGWADKDHAAECHSCPPGPCPVPSAVPWQQTQTLCLGGQYLPFSRLKITSIWQAQGHPPSKYFHLLRAEMDGNGLAFSIAAVTGFSLLALPDSSSSPRSARSEKSHSEGSSLGKEM